MMKNSPSLTGVAIGSLTLASFFLPGCGRPAPPQAATSGAAAQSFDSTPARSKESRLAEVVSYGNGIYVFPAESFPRTLSDFMDAHPELTLISFSQGRDVRDSRGNHAIGYAENFVVTFKEGLAR